MSTSSSKLEDGVGEAVGLAGAVVDLGTTVLTELVDEGTAVRVLVELVVLGISLVAEAVVVVDGSESELLTSTLRVAVSCNTSRRTATIWAIRILYHTILYTRRLERSGNECWLGRVHAGAT